MKDAKLKAVYSNPNQCWQVYFGSTRTDIRGEYSWDMLEDLNHDLRTAGLRLTESLTITAGE